MLTIEEARQITEQAQAHAKAKQEEEALQYIESHYSSAINNAAMQGAYSTMPLDSPADLRLMAIIRLVLTNYGYKVKECNDPSKFKISWRSEQES